ncbi:4'-phosphopantetheinyl transferase family protein [Arachnia propionica]|uniref:4'-phosphopantetheinyl transferase superfamily protein n=1 Tax=Arachnia propionica TaxID=1750 RepID=A0A3S4UDW4_9ACTN|nr:4'-phosphopantetheinyl transferase superfamily protein [Arachnia propionica]QUC10251.1 4'-phosphopantetheinyl transferase superfamily protein [Arachnia propionica]QUC15064.1 4'-phosphopantetheinyl transferase superfamily protein [Arachnia propionica]VEH69709.1 phosphopantetheinyltransferase component of enterobactin synthase multienzyme complex [Arachnia propionica]VEJ58108.1 phosphopantetheinyltransferase component of enterobactin synthase multienzyme complex [Arachnia propionica]
MTAIAARGNSSPLSGARAPSQLMPELFAPDVSVWEVRDEKVREELHPEEQQYIERAVAKRQLEFARARYCARQALDRFGLERPSMIPGIAGEPSWPQGIIGSMTHCEGYAAAAVAPRARLVSLGLDAEVDAPLPERVLGLVALPSEIRRLALLGALEPALHWDRILFSCKESVYKAWYPLAHKWLGFEDAELALRLDGTFRARLLVEGPAVPGGRLRLMAGAWRSREGLLLSAVSVPAGDVTDGEQGLDLDVASTCSLGNRACRDLMEAK